MLQNAKLDGLILRANTCQAKKAGRSQGNPMSPLDEKDMDFVSSKLGVVLPDDFRQISRVFDYEYLGNFQFPCFCFNGESGVVEETLGTRESLNLPHEFVILSVEDDVSVLLLETQDCAEKPSPVIWCDMFPDFFNICEGKPMEQNPTIWPSFTDFFEYLVEQEEAKLKEG